MLRDRVTTPSCASPDAFLVDVQLPPALARWLVEHVVDHHLQSASDRQIWDFALYNSFAIVTKDEDFAQRRALTEVGPLIVWMRFPNSRRRDLLDWFGQVLPEILNALDRGEAIIEVI